MYTVQTTFIKLKSELGFNLNNIKKCSFESCSNTCRLVRGGCSLTRREPDHSQVTFSGVPRLWSSSCITTSSPRTEPHLSLQQHMWVTVSENSEIMEDMKNHCKGFITEYRTAD